MALPSSGTITMGMIREELEQTGAISLGSTECRNLAGVSSGAIKMSDFYGKSSKIKHEIDWICGEIEYRAQAGPNIASIGSVYGYGKSFDGTLDNSIHKLKRNPTIYSKSSEFSLYLLVIQHKFEVFRVTFSNNNLSKGRIRVTVKSSVKNIISEYSYDPDVGGKIDTATISKGSALDLSQFGANRITITFEEI